MSDRILFVDDDTNLLAAFRRQLRKQFQIDTAEGGLAGLELVKTNGPYAVIVSDFRMPLMDGIEFLSRVREMAPETVRIMLTGNADLQAAIQAVNEGNIFRFLTKPCSVDILGESLITGIEHYQHAAREREYNEKARISMAKAGEVQKHLIPQADPIIEGLDIAGRSIYCDETGGDYYDFLDRGKNCHATISVVVGDVSEHGISSALLMTSARAFLRERSLKTGTIAGIVSDVNKQLTRDIEMSNRFMTLFYSEIDATQKQIRWVRAGHDPAILYDPEQNRFEELKGPGLPLGVVKDAEYHECECQITNGQIIVITTDGIGEAANRAGEMFGKERLKNIIRLNADKPARAIVDAMLDAVEQFIHPLPHKDDATLVVIKLDR